MDQSNKSKAKLMPLIHQATNCEQAMSGYVELNEWIKARVVAMECRAELTQIIAELDKIIADEEEG